MKAQNIFLDENTGGKGRYFKARILQPGLVKYSFGVCLLEKETIDKFVNEFVGCPVIIGHNDVTTENADKLVGGHICHIWYDNADGWYWVDGIIDDQDALDKIDDGWNVSCQYEITEYSNNTDGKLHNGNPYDKVILNGKPEHLAIVATPRYENAMIAVNAIDLTEDIEMYATNEDKWITVHPGGGDGGEGKGRHLLLKDGETPKEAMQRQWGIYDKRQAKENKSNEPKDITKEEHEKIKEQVGKMSDDELVKAHFESMKGWENENMKAGILSKHEAMYGEVAQELKKRTGRAFSTSSREDEIREALSKGKEESDKKEAKKYTWGDKKYTLDELVEQGFKPMKYSGSIYKNDHLTYLEKDDGKKLYRLKISEDEYQEQEAKRRERNRPIGLSDVSTLLTDESKFKKFADDLYNDDVYPSKANVSGELRQKLYHIIHTNSPLTKSEWEEKLRRQLKKISAKNSIIQAINELKDTDMFKSLFRKKESEMNKDEMKQIFAECLQEVLIAKNEEEDELKKAAENEDEELEEDIEVKEEKAANKKCKNEDVDKRKLIDAVAGIMKSAGCDDEVIRTAIAKMEKLAYDKSEAATADNGKKAKCEDEEEDKEEAKNKAKNAIENCKGLFASAGVAKASSKYVTQSDAIDLGNQLF